MVGLAQCLERAHQLRDIVHPSPLVTVALYRVLLAILHRNFGPASMVEWGRLRDAGRFDAGLLERYWQAHRAGFDLFDPERPFFQSPIEERYATSIAKMVHQRASGANPTLFDHSVDDAPPALSPADAACYLVAAQAFSMGGLQSFEPGNAAHRSADSAPLVGGAAFVAKGSTLFDTLLLNLHQYGGEAPFPKTRPGPDLPAWERESLIGPGDRDPIWYLDYLTWQSRRIRLFPERDPEGQTVVRKVAVMKGEQFPSRVGQRDWETMLAFTRNQGATGAEQPWRPLGFTRDRVLWRDSLSLVESFQTGRRDRPKVVDWLNQLMGERYLAEQTFRFDAYGLAGDKAKVLFWRHERLHVPSRYLSDKELVAALESVLDGAEYVGRLLWAVAPTRIRRSSDGREEPGEPLVDRSELTRRYWIELSPRFEETLSGLAEQRAELGAEWEPAKDELLREWIRSLRRAAFSAFDAATDRLDLALRVVVEARRNLAGSLTRLTAAQENGEGEGEAA